MKAGSFSCSLSVSVFLFLSSSMPPFPSLFSLRLIDRRSGGGRRARAGSGLTNMSTFSRLGFMAFRVRFRPFMVQRGLAHRGHRARWGNKGQNRLGVSLGDSCFGKLVLVARFSQSGLQLDGGRFNSAFQRRMLVSEGSVLKMNMDAP